MKSFCLTIMIGVLQLMRANGLQAQPNSELSGVQVPDSMVFETWDAATSQWIGNRKNVYTYNAEGKILTQITYNQDNETRKWIADGKVKNTYDANGNETLLLWFSWQENTSLWVPSQRYVNYYS
jgi:hypothetical protein